MTPDIETGFGTGLRSLLERKQNGDAQPATPAAAAPEPDLQEQQRAMQQATAGMVSTPVIVEAFVPDLGPELDALRTELDAALSREVELREEAHAACRAAAERETELEAWSRELESRSESLESRAAALENPHRTNAQARSRQAHRVRAAPPGRAQAQ